MLDDAPRNLTTNQPLDPREWSEEKIHDGPEQTVMDAITNHRRGDKENSSNDSIAANFDFHSSWSLFIDVRVFNSNHVTPFESWNIL